MRSAVFFLFLPAMLRSAFGAELELPELPGTCRQVIAVSSPSWDSSNAILQRLERRPSERWTTVGPDWAVRLGKNGMTWGRGLHAIPSGHPGKREGDRKSPVGIFRLGTAFGYAPAAPDGTRLDWRQATDRDFFVDDPGSPDYNRWVRLEPGVVAPWRTAEVMGRPDPLYEFGIVVRHNMDPVAAGSGSAIFLHVWGDPGSATAGCTAMDRENLITLLVWLDPSKEPLLVQAPRIEFAGLRLR